VAGDPRIHEGLQVVEQWNSANVAIYYGNEGELTGATHLTAARAAGPRRRFSGPVAGGDGTPQEFLVAPRAG
jgi:hypothetical protein